MATMKNSLLLLIIVSVLAAKPHSGQAERLPNIIILLIDDMGYGDIAAHGNPLLKTPGFDRLHRESVRFTDFLVSPTCSPTRAALLSGMHELKVGVSHTIAGRNRMNPEATILPQILKDAGYHTAMFGKWHLGFEEDVYRPHNRGFDLAVNHVTDSQRSHYDPVLVRNGKEEKHEGYRTDIFFNEAMSYIERQSQREQPFFCYLATFSPHSPLTVPQKYLEPYEGKSRKPGFHGMVANVDENLGRLMAKLDELGIADNTLLIAMGDNGGTYGIDTWNAGMRGAKAKAYLGAVRTFSFWRWTNRLQPGVRDQLTCHQDVLPTLVSLTKAPIEPNHRRQLDGFDLSPLLRKNVAGWKGKDRMIVHHSTRWPDGEEEQHKYTYCGVRWQKWHLVRQHPCVNPTCGQSKKQRAAICTLDRRRLTAPTLPGFYGDLQHYQVTEPGKWSLFDLTSDPHEDRTIADQNKKVVEHMSGQFERWWAQFGFHQK